MYEDLVVLQQNESSVVLPYYCQNQGYKAKSVYQNDLCLKTEFIKISEQLKHNVGCSFPNYRYVNISWEFGNSTR